MPGAGESGNVIAAVCSFFFPGLGQLVQGRVLRALFIFLLAGAIWFFTLGLLAIVGHIIAAVDAAVWKGPR